MRPMSASIAAPAPRARARTAHHAVTVLAGLSLAMIVAGCNLPGSSAAGNAADSSTITVGVVPGIDNATLALAQQNGLFTAAGIKVKIVDYASVKAEMTALRTNAINIADGDYGDLFFAQASAPSPIYQIVADGYDAAPGVLELMTLPSSRIKSPIELAGRQIGVPDTQQLGAPTDAPDSLSVAAATAVLQSFSVNLSAVRWQPMAPLDEIRALQHGQVQAALLAEPYIYLAQRQLGAVQLVDACSGSTAGLPLSGYFSTTSWSRNNTAAVTAFRSAIEQAAANAAMPGPVQAVLPGYAKLTKQEAALVTVGVYPAATISASLQRTADLLFGVGVIRNQLNVAAMIVH
jgi:NitT/TauT family transport system substrate-binding protein